MSSSIDLVQGLYLTVYNRSADWGGLLFWSARLDAEGFEAVAAAFTAVPEFDTLYGGLSLEEQVALIYQHLLGRGPDPGGLAFWSGQLGRPGATVAQVARALAAAAQGTDGEAFAARVAAASEQSYGDLVDVLYAGYYGRGADSGGRSFWVEQLVSSGGALGPVVQAFGNSEEYQQLYAALAPEEQVTRLFQNLFDRSPDPEGLGFWSGQLQSGALDLSQIAFAVAQGARGQDVAALAATVARLRSPADPPGPPEEPGNPGTPGDPGQPEEPGQPVSLSLSEALELEVLPARYTIDPTQSLLLEDVPLAELAAVLTEVSVIFQLAQNTTSLPEDLFSYAVRDSAATILAAAADNPLLTAPLLDAARVEASDASLSLADFEALTQLPNFFADGLDVEGIRYLSVSENELRAAVADGSYAVTFEGASFSFEDSTHNVDISRVTSLATLFRETDFNADIGYWDTGSVADMRGLFFNNTVFNQDISGWNTSGVTDMRAVFFGANAFDQPIGSWDTSNVMLMDNLFDSATSFNQPLDTWDTSEVMSMRSMFFGASAFDQPIGSWNTSSVVDMDSMFFGASHFAQDLSGWSVTQIPLAPPVFAEGAPLAELPEFLPRWGEAPLGDEAIWVLGVSGVPEDPMLG